MDHDNGDERLAAWMAFLRAHAAVTSSLERELQERCGLPLTWFEVLVCLRGAATGMRMQELARMALLSKSGLTRAVDRMEAAGLVQRRSCERDRRGTYVALTAAGHAALERATPVQLEAIRTHFTRHLRADELDVLARGLDRVAEAGGFGPITPCDIAAGAAAVPAPDAATPGDREPESPDAFPAARSGVGH